MITITNFVYRFTALCKIKSKFVCKRKHLYTIIIFPKHGHGRIMGKEANEENLQKEIGLNYKDFQLQTKTMVMDLNRQIDIDTLKIGGFYEPELFAARTVRYKNLVINIFHTGKVVILGVKNQHSTIVHSIVYDLIINEKN